MTSASRRSRPELALALALAACASPTGAPHSAARADVPDDLAPPRRWPCPEGWVAGAQGGCGPRALLCGPDGGALADACHSTDDASPFRLAADGALLGAWPEEGAPGGPPASDWQPDAGIGACPTRWTMQPDRTCDPSLSARCVAPAEAIPGGGCTSLDECGASPWPDAPALAAGARALRVRAGDDDAVADGSERLPYGTLSRALEVARDGDAVLLAPGAYVAGVRLTQTLSLVGRCAARVALTATTGAVVRVASAEGVTIRGITLRGGADGLVVEAGARATLRASVAEAQTARGLVADGVGAALTAEDVVSRPGEVARPVLDAVAVTAGSLTLRRAVLRAGSSGAVIALRAGSQARLEDVSLRGGMAGNAGTRVALRVGDGASLAGSRLALEGAYGGALLAGAGVGARGDVLLRDVAVRAPTTRHGEEVVAVFDVANADVALTRVHVEGARGFASWVQANQRASLTLREVVLRAGDAGDAAPEVGIDTVGVGTARVDAVGLRVEGPRRVGIDVGEGARVELDDVLVAEGAASATFHALRVEHAQASLRVRRARLDELRHAALTAHLGSEATLEDAVVRWVADAPPRDAVRTGAVMSVLGAALTLRRARLLHPPLFGVTTYGDGSRAVVEDSVIADVRGDGNVAGVGLLASQRASLSASRVRVDGARLGASATGDARIELRGCALLGIARHGGAGGVGLVVHDGATATVTATLLARHDAFGAAVFARATLDGSDVVVAGVRGVSWYEGRALDEPILGAGVVALQGSAVALSRLVVVESRGAGVLAAVTASPDGGLGAVTPASVTLDDLYVRGVAAASLGATTQAASGRVAAAVRFGDSSTPTLRRALLVDADDGVVTLSPRTTLNDVVTHRMRGCALATGVRVANGEGLSRAVTPVAVARPACLGEHLGEFTVPVLDL